MKTELQQKAHQLTQDFNISVLRASKNTTQQSTALYVEASVIDDFADKRVINICFTDAQDTGDDVLASRILDAALRVIEFNRKKKARRAAQEAGAGEKF